MRYRSLGNTGIRVSEIGFGTWGIGGVTEDGPNSYGVTDDAASKRALLRAFDLGITFFDTANIYGYGHSERILGEVFKKRRDKIVIASKVGFTRHGGPHNIAPAYIRECLEGSLRRLQTDYIDIYQLHSPPLSLVDQMPEAIDELKRLESEGKVRSFGYSVKSPEDGMVAIGRYGCKVVQVNFSMIDQRAIECDLFDIAVEAGTGIISRTPLAFGFLTGKIGDIRFDARDHRSTWPEAQLKRWASAPALFAPLNEGKSRTLTDLALRFCLAFDAVSTVIPGILLPKEAEENARASDLPDLSEDERSRVKEIYRSHRFFV